jgi:hypothetical protein
MTSQASRVLPLCAAGLLLAATSPAAVHAAEFVAGNYGPALTGGAALEAAEPTAADQDAAAAGDDSSSSSAVLFDFTPRGADLPDLGGDSPRLRFELGVGGQEAAPGGGLDALGLGGSAGPAWLDETGGSAEQQQPRLSLGGALLWSGWTVGGGFARTNLAGGAAADLVSATVGYGPLTASLAIGQADGPEQQSRDVLMLSTDLSAWSWLTLESDVALGDSADRDEAGGESVAVGRLGVRLNF